ncbi:DUF7453 family protein [Aeoliella sp. SH292]|uniref:DUF7453 family protein n=1 Tax=Aeoliella sp. SH292 TaxID=3454464 RepID=UPI003F9A5618
MSLSRCILSSVVLAALSFSTAASGDAIRAVALTTRTITDPQIDAEGRTSFWVANLPPRLLAGEDLGAFFTTTAVVDVSSPGLYAERQLGFVERIAAPSDQPPGLGAGFSYGTFSQMHMNDRGDIQFTSAVQGPDVSGVNNEAFFVVDRDGVARLVFRENQEFLPPIWGGESAHFRFLPNHQPSLDEQGRVTFAAYPTTPGTFATRILQEQSGQIAVLDDVVTVSTTTGPTRDDPPQSSLLEVTTMSINAVSSASNGNVVFAASLVPRADNNTQFQTTNAIVRSHADGMLSPVVLVGTQIDGATVSSIFRPVMNARGDIASLVSIDGPPSTRGILRASEGHLSWVARGGEVAPGSEPGTTFAGIDSVINLNEAGDLLFLAYLDVPGSTPDEGGLFLDRPGMGIVSVARIREQAPGTEAGAGFQFLRSTAAAINNAGQVAFHAELSATPSNRNSGIWATDRHGNLQLIVREGDMLDVSDVGEPADFRTISTLSFHAGGGGGTASGSGFNDNGQLAFRARFTDGTRGIFVSNAVAIPEPATVAILLLGITAIGVHRRARRTR